MSRYLALAVSLEQLGESTSNDKALLLGQTLTAATGKLLENNKSPSRKVNELDNRGSNFYVALYWAEELAKHDGEFAELAKALKAWQLRHSLERFLTCFSAHQPHGHTWGVP